MKKISLFIIVLLVLCGCQQKEEVTDSQIREVERKQLSDGSFVSSFVIDGHQIIIYQPEDVMRSDLINYGYSAPLLLVFGDEKMDEDEAVSFICEKGIDRIAQKNGGFVVFVDPVKSWDKEEYGIYEKIMEKTAVGQTGFSHGLIYDDADEAYFIFASPAATTVCGYGKGADYIAENYLKECKGYSSMSALGSDDITMSAAVLEKLSRKPKIASEDIIIVSVDNESFDEKGDSDHYYMDNGSFDELYERYIAGHQVWNGKLSETFYPGKNGILMEIQTFDIETSDDNLAVKDDHYEVGAVVFRKEDGSKEKKPLLLCFHGGGDTAITTASIAGWPQIACENDFILCAIEMHTRTSAAEVMEITERLKEIYEIDESRIYATGFSMGGIKTWDLYQEYPQAFAALAPMGATVDVGKNCQFSDAPHLNEDVLVPVFYSGGENSQLQELPFQGYNCVRRINYLMRVNDVETDFDLSVGNRSEWTDSVYGYEGDIVEELKDEAYPDSTTTVRYYRSRDGQIYTALCSIFHHQHEIRPFTCEKAWEFMSRFARIDGRIVILE